MKKYKIFNKTGLAICLTLGLVAGSACSQTDDGMRFRKSDRAAIFR